MCSGGIRAGMHSCASFSQQETVVSPSLPCKPIIYSLGLFDICQILDITGGCNQTLSLGGPHSECAQSGSLCRITDNTPCRNLYVDLLSIFQICLFIYDLLYTSYPWVSYQVLRQSSVKLKSCPGYAWLKAPGGLFTGGFEVKGEGDHISR